MKPEPRLGDLTRSMITDIPVNLNTDETSKLKKTIMRFPEEAVYIYSFKEKRSSLIEITPLIISMGL